jgi:hypothetical protein
MIWQDDEWNLSISMKPVITNGGLLGIIYQSFIFFLILGIGELMKMCKSKKK